MPIGNMAPNFEGKILVGNPILENAFQWIPESAFEEVWAPLGWVRAAINEDNVAYLPEQAEPTTGETADPEPQA
jgi:hypothetical protein